MNFPKITVVFFCYANGKNLGKPGSATGYFLNGKFIKFRLDNMLLMSVDGTVAHWEANTTGNENLTTFAVSPAFRAYFFKQIFPVCPYVQLSVGPAYLSSDAYGGYRQGSRFAFQDRLAVGTELDFCCLI